MYKFDSSSSAAAPGSSVVNINTNYLPDMLLLGMIPSDSLPEHLPFLTLSPHSGSVAEHEQELVAIDTEAESNDRGNDSNWISSPFTKEE